MSTIEKTFNNGEVIIKEGDSGNTFFQLLEGKAAVYKNYGQNDEVQVAILDQGHCLKKQHLKSLIDKALLFYQ